MNMAEKEHVKDEVVKEKTTSVHAHNGVSAPVAVVPRHSRQWVIGVVAIIIVVYLMLMVAGLWIFHAVAAHQNAATTNTRGVLSEQQVNRRGFGMTGDRTYNVRQTNSDGLTATTTTTTYTQTQGVVTAVNSDSIVVAGGGKTQTIKTNSSTAYANDTKAAVNDTVVIVGTKDGNTITATQIAVYN